MSYQYKTLTLARDYWLFLKGRRLRFVVFTLLRMFATTFAFAIAYCLGRVVDFFTMHSRGEPLTEFYILVGLIAALGSLQVWLRFFTKMRLYKIAAEIRKSSRVLAMTKLIDLDLAWHEKEDTGSKIQKINNGGESIYEAMHQFANFGIEIIVGFGGALVLFAVLDWKYILYAALYAGIYLLGEYYFNKRLTYWRDRLNMIQEKVSGKIHESAANLLTVKSMGLKDSFTQSTTKHEQEYYDVWLKTKLTSQQKSKTVKIFSALGYAGFILLTGFDALAGAITVGSIFVYVSYLGRLKLALQQLTDNMNNFIKAKSGVGRFMTIVGKEVFERNSPDMPDVKKKWKTIEFVNVTFRYKKKTVLKDFNLVIRRGERIGIVGRSGCGKSTLVKLLLGLYKPQKGKVLIDGLELTDYKQNSVTRTISVVLQDSEMFNDTLKNNIAISANGVDRKRLLKAIEVSQLKPVIKNMPKGINTLIGEKGYKMSGGERQRLGIARAVYKDASLFLLDEATSHLDSRTENKIQDMLDKKLADKTMILIAHRLSTLKDTDRIIVMEDGHIVDEGRFDGLVKKKGLFSRLYRLQDAK
jgi:ABC-type multidrug transport system fused ATPase/permease subunit